MKKKKKRKGPFRLPFNQFSDLILCDEHKYGPLYEHKINYFIKVCSVCTHIMYKHEIRQNHVEAGRVKRPKLENEHLTLFMF